MRRDLRENVAGVALHGHVVRLDHAKHERRVHLEDAKVWQAAPQAALQAIQALGIAKVGHRRVGHPPTAGVVEVGCHAHVAPCAPLGCHAGLAQGPAVAGKPIQEGVGRRVVELAHVAVHGGGGEEPIELQARVLVALKRVVQEEGGAGLGLEDGVELLPGLVVEHGVLQDSGRVDEAREVWGLLPDVLLHGLLLAAVTFCLRHGDAQLRGKPLNLLPIWHVLIIDLH
mmetsp:Transcript_83142/g.248068  ORF Transcript_83142/g.248068 Transcript_83142/m.248068 type:complete len:228 (-) Transcript_83142:1093-1776(-)